MAKNEKTLTISEFDFDNVKDNLKTFLSAQTEFTDYDFEGSGMSVLLDVLAYNTHYLGFNMNMLANEMFLDSSVLRSSVVSHAKTLGYEIASPRSPKAVVDINLFDSNIASATVPAGTVFLSTVDDIVYQFVTITDHTSASIGNQIQYKNIPIYEGTFVTTRYTVNSADVEQRFLLADERADTDTLVVRVQTSVSDSTTTTYTKTTDISQLTSTSANYFLQEVENGKFEVYFGDGIVGKSVSDGNLVILTYVVSNEFAANTASVFTNANAIATVTDVQVSTVSPASGGSSRETTASVKLNAPLDFASQGRCVTSEDYKVFVRRFFPNTQAVAIFGGETGSFDPSLGVVATQEFGKVFISVKSTTGNNLTNEEKTRLVNDLQPFTVASITPVIVDPETVFIILSVSARFNPSLTTETSESLKTLINATLNNYNNDKLKTFSSLFRYSELLGLIDDTNAAIVSNTTDVSLAKFFTPTLAEAKGYRVNFNNSIFNPHAGHNSESGGVISSTGFKISGNTTNEMFFDDDGNGNIRRYFVSGGVKQYQDNAAGTVDYGTGNIVINSINITTISSVDGLASTQIKITVKPKLLDVTPVRNQILEIDFVNSSIIVNVDTISVGGTSETPTSTLATQQVSSSTAASSTTTTTSTTSGATTTTTTTTTSSTPSSSSSSSSSGSSGY